MSKFNPIVIEALADAWASIDGKMEEFRAGKEAASIEAEPGGYYSGYMSDADELAKRLLKRGYIIMLNRPRRFRDLDHDALENEGLKRAGYQRLNDPDA